MVRGCFSNTGREQGVPAEVLGRELREFSEEDAASRAGEQDAADVPGGVAADGVVPGLPPSPREVRAAQERGVQPHLDARPAPGGAGARAGGMWADNGKGPIDIEHYEASRTVHHALSVHADEAYDKLNPEEKLIAKKMFQALTETDKDKRRIRRPACLSDIVSICSTDSEKVMAVIDKFRKGDRNFLVLTSGKLEDDPLIDISHESLIRLWERLSSWVDEEAESARIYWRLADTAESYAEGKAGPYHGTDLQVADDWWTENKPTQAWAKRYHSGFSRAKQFLELSKKEQERIEREKEQYQLTQKLSA